MKGVEGRVHVRANVLYDVLRGETGFLSKDTNLLSKVYVCANSKKVVKGKIIEVKAKRE